MFEMKKVEMKKRKNIALIAHDHRKQDLLTWAAQNREHLEKHCLYGTGTTSKLLSKETGLKIKAFLSGPLGGDQQIGARIAEGDIDFMVFFWDPLSAQPHDPDVKALLRIAVLYDIPIAMNQSTADFLFSSDYMDEAYERRVLDYSSRLSSIGDKKNE